jgi:hypothetical protein
MKYETFVCDLCGSEHPKETYHEVIVLNRYSSGTGKETDCYLCKECSEAIHKVVDSLDTK